MTGSRLFAALLARIEALFRRRRFDAELDEELQFHLDAATARHVDRGLPWPEARRAAARQLGNLESTREAVLDESGARLFQDIGRDVAIALRQLVRHPTLAVSAIGILAVCIATTAAVFSVVNAVLWQPLPYPDSTRIVRLYNSYPQAGFPRTGTSVPELFDRQERSRTLTDLALYRQESNTVGTEQGGQHTFALRVTPSFFPLLGVTPTLGRVFVNDDASAAEAPPVVLGYQLWQSAFAGRTDIVNSEIHLDRRRFVVVGVLPQTFRFPTWDAQVFTPLFFADADRAVAQRHQDEHEMLGRLAPSVTAAQAEAEVNAINASLLPTYPATLHRTIVDAGYRTVVTPYLEDLTRDVRMPFLILWLGALLVLAIGIANMTTLLLLRARSRAREVTLQLVLGASCFRVARQFLVESVVLAGVATPIGLIAAQGALQMLAAFDVYEIPRVGEIALGRAAIGWSLLVALVAAVTTGVVPAWSAVRARETTGLASRTSTAVTTWPQRLLVGAQMAFALTLVITAGLLANSLRHLMAVNPGFDPTGVTVAAAILPGDRYPTREARVDLMSRLLEHIETAPGVLRASAASQLPFSGIDGRAALTAEGGDASLVDALGVPINNIVSAGYFDAMRIAVVHGRGFTSADDLRGPRVAVIDETLARRYWPDGAVGQRFWFGTRIGPPAEAITIVGVVTPVLHNSLRDRASEGAIYRPLSQEPVGFVRLAIRLDAGGQWSTVRARLADVDASLVPFWTEPLSDSVSATLLLQRGPLTLLGVFAAVGLLLGVLGVYGVLSQEFSHRRKELAIRMALGGTQTQILALLARRWGGIVVTGIAGGILGATASERIVRTLLFETAATEPAVIALSAGVLAAAALLAAVGPARQALAVDPMLALKSD